jgi:hypothetical protein
MKLTVINPDDPDVPPREYALKGASEDTDANDSVPVWEGYLFQHTPAGNRLKHDMDGTISDLCGWQAVISTDDGDVRIAGVIDDTEVERKKYRVRVVETPSPTPRF